MRSLARAYLAGVIDSDGTIGIKRNSYAMRVTKDCGQPTYSERVCVKQVTPTIIDILHRAFGGTRRIDAPTAKGGQPLHVWQVTDVKCTRALLALSPFLRLKRAQARNCLALRRLKERSKRYRVRAGRGHVGGSRRPARISEAMERCYQRAHELNRVGTKGVREPA